MGRRGDTRIAPPIPWGMSDAPVSASPLTRLVVVVEKLHYDGAQAVPKVPTMQTSIGGRGAEVPVLGGLIAFYLGYETSNVTFSQREMVSAYGEMIKITDSAFKFVEKNSGDRSRKTNLSYINLVMEILSSHSTLSPGFVFTHGSGVLIRDKMDHLAALEENLRAYNEEFITPSEKITEIVESLDDLIEVIMKSDIDLRLKDRMLQTLGAMRTQALRINTVGVNDLLDGLDMVMGQLARVARDAETSEKKAEIQPLLERGIQSLDKVQKIVDFAQKNYPLVKAFARNVGLDILP